MPAASVTLPGEHSGGIVQALAGNFRSKWSRRHAIRDLCGIQGLRDLRLVLGTEFANSVL